MFKGLRGHVEKAHSCAPVMWRRHKILSPEEVLPELSLKDKEKLATKIENSRQCRVKKWSRTAKIHI